MKKRVYSLDELNAYKVAYGKPIERKELLMSLIKPFAVVFVFSYALYYYWWLSLILGTVGMFYGYRVMMPQSIKRVYEANAFRERNNFINNLTQILTNSERTMLKALETVTSRANGEFKEDLLQLQLSLQGASNKEIQSAFQQFGEKYKHDVIFDLYVEQLTTAMIEGRTNIDTIKDIKSLHNELKKEQDKFLQKKKRATYEFRFISIISLVLIGAVTFSFGWSQFVDVYAHQITGWIASAIYLSLLGGFFHSYLKRLGDDNIMEVKI
ncbi:hypothetical protein [Bacillus paralicheniformis]|uniref:hypothetical protein n=1 Tax=Bacillus paralicheniformis TaxID=1648923 RepID=UPI00227FAE0C|nr:hypothetical protein [Bacillus paralicheniformis]MCY8151331.1 hypothetical protein [Bacillus paralicheniformis]